ncbi:N-acetylmuramoyl-L-alanine amidase family protein [Leuconostoc falkenbergense]|uniref:N-acetylmuramoyl-L-alanine amidase family protein n=1 Tax=Leuconostoc falkenbergense TaxID=2766470 RepID=UPI003D156203
MVTKNGWVTDDNQTFYYENNQKVTGEKYVNGYWYLFDKHTDGAMVTGLQNLAGYGQKKTVYYNANGQMMYGQQKINGNWYLFNKWNGAMVTGLQNLAGYGQKKTVYYNVNGQMMYGQQKINGNWYLFDKWNGAMVTGLQNLAGYGQKKTVYYNNNGQMMYGQQKVNGNWYLFDKWNGAMLTGLQNLAGYGQNKTVCYKTNGQMLYGEQKINGNWYLFDKLTGAMQKTYQQVIAPTVNVAGWAGLCLKYVDDAFGISYSDGQRSYTARLSAQKAMNNQTMHYDNSFPKGVMVPVYWNLVNKEDGINYGHIAIWDGKSGFYWESTNGSKAPNHLTWDQINQIFAGKRKVNGSYLNSNWRSVSFIGWSETLENTRIVKVK